MLYGSQSTPAKLVTAGVSLIPTWLSAMAAIRGPSPMAAVGAARRAAARCPAAVAAQLAGVARPQSRRSPAGRPAPQP